MLILILETSTEKGAIILSCKDTPIAVTPLSGGPSLSRCLTLETKKLLGERIPDLIAVGTGPGSYTGIRVGVALAKALAYGWKIPIMGFCSLEAFAPRPVLVDARSGGFYALIEENPILIPVEDPLIQNISHFSSPHVELIQKRLPNATHGVEKDPSPKHLSELIYTRFLEGKTPSLELTYLSSP